MKRILRLRQIFDITLGVMLIGTLVFFFAFGLCLWIARQQVTRDTDRMTERNLAYVQENINSELVRVEDACYTLAGNAIGEIVRHADGTAHVAILPQTIRQSSEEDCYAMMESFLRTNPFITGISVAFEPDVYPARNARYGYAPSVVRVGDELHRHQIGETLDYRSEDWYRWPRSLGRQCWTDPFIEQSRQRRVAAFAIPLYSPDSQAVGVLALTVNVGDFAERLRAASPYEGAKLVLLSDSVDYYASLPFHYVFTNAHSEGTYMLICPEHEIMGGLRQMQRDIAIIGAISLVLMIVLFIFLFRHMQKIQMAKMSMESELKVASRIQMAMIPKGYPAFPERSELDVYGYLRPAKSVGGDLYDYFIRDDKFFFTIGDVSGKGVPASLFMAVARALFRHVTLHCDSPAEIASALNDGLCEGNETNMFCTMFIGVLDLRTGHLSYCNAGHNAPVIRRRDAEGQPVVSYMKPEVNLALGVFPDFPYCGEQTDLRPGEALLLYTDGVTEAENASHRLFGEQAVLDCLHRTREKSLLTAKDFVDHLVTAIDHHAGGVEQSDDITLLVVEYKGA